MAIQIQSTYSIQGWQGERLKRRVIDVLTDYAKELDQQFKAEIKEPQFNWPGITRRYGKLLRTTSLKSRSRILAAQGGKPFVTVGSPRDIVDSGDFLRSQRRERPNPTEVVFTWGNDTVVSYAGIILRGKGAGYPSRDWIKPALEAVPFERFFLRAWSARRSR